MTPVQSTLIVSVYTNDRALRLIIKSLLKQSTKNFNVIISEDGESEAIQKLLTEFSNTPFTIRHITQKDDGFRKNIALNNSIKASETDHIIFIDGDCVLHPQFIASHQRLSQQGTACAGRRIELGERFSSKLISGSYSLARLTHPLLYFLNLPELYLDKAKNVESGIFSTLLQFFNKNKKTAILGCNFSCHKSDLQAINGFNEDYLAAGTGEDSDINWRLLQLGVNIRNVKFSAVQYHLYHKKNYSTSERNRALLEKTKKSTDYRCQNGLVNLREN